jgi:hypothetical protein
MKIDTNRQSQIAIGLSSLALLFSGYAVINDGHDGPGKGHGPRSGGNMSFGPPPGSMSQQGWQQGGPQQGGPPQGGTPQQQDGQQKTPKSGSTDSTGSR